MHKPSPSQERTIRAHQTQRILELLAGKYVEPNGAWEVTSMLRRKGFVIAMLREKDGEIDLADEKI